MILKGSRFDQRLAPDAARDLADRMVLMTRELLARYRLSEEMDEREGEARDLVTLIRDRRRELWEKTAALIERGTPVADAAAKVGLALGMAANDARAAFAVEAARQKRLAKARRNLGVVDAFGASQSNAQIAETFGLHPASVGNLIKQLRRAGGGKIAKMRRVVETRIAEIEGEGAPPARPAAPPRPPVLFAGDEALSSDDPILLGLDLWIEEMDKLRALNEDDPRNQLISKRAAHLMETVVETASFGPLGIAAKLRAAWPIWQVMPERWEWWALIDSAMRDAERLAGRVPKLKIADRFPDAFMPRQPTATLR